MDQWDDLMLALNSTVKIYVDNHPDGGNDKFSHLLFAYRKAFHEFSRFSQFSGILEGEEFLGLVRVLERYLERV